VVARGGPARAHDMAAHPAGTPASGVSVSTPAPARALAAGP